MLDIQGARADTPQLLFFVCALSKNTKQYTFSIPQNKNKTNKSNGNLKITKNGRPYLINDSKELIETLASELEKTQLN